MEGKVSLIVIDNSDTVARCAIVPTILENGRFSPSNVVHPLSRVGDRFACSVISRKLMPQDDKVHSFGCQLADIKRSREREKSLKKHGREPRRPGETSHYLGFFDIEVGKIRAINSRLAYYNIDVLHVPTDNNAHCHVDVALRAKDAPAIECGKERTIIAAEFAEIVGSFSGHMCECDLDIADYLSAIRVTTNRS